MIRRADMAAGTGGGGIIRVIPGQLHAISGQLRAGAGEVDPIPSQVAASTFTLR
jgi:hypothetical protein